MKKQNKLGIIKFLAERKVNMVEMDFDVEDETLDIIASCALEMIKEDKSELFGYAMRKAFESFARGEGSWTLQLPKKKRSSKKS